MAVEALTEFAVRTFASDLATSVSVTAGGQTPVQKSVDATNRLLLQEAKVPELTVSSQAPTERGAERVQFYFTRFLFATFMGGCVLLFARLLAISSFLPV